MPDITLRNERKTVCDRCRWVQYLRFASHNDPIRWCGQLGRRMPDMVVECSLQVAPGTMVLSEMHQAAWLLDPLPEGKIGFVRPGTVEHSQSLGFIAPTIRGPR